MIKLFSSILLGFWENPKLGSAIANKLMNSRVLLVLLIILRSSVLLSQAPTRIAWFNLLKSVWLSLSSQPRRAFYSTSSTCQAIFRKFLFYSTACASDQPFSFSSAGGEFYRIIDRCQHPPQPLLKTLFKSAEPYNQAPTLSTNQNITYCFGRLSLQKRWKWAAL